MGMDLITVRSQLGSQQTTTTTVMTNSKNTFLTFFASFSVNVLVVFGSADFVAAVFIFSVTPAETVEGPRLPGCTVSFDVSYLI